MSIVLSLPDFDLPTRSASGFLLRWIVPRAGVEPATLFAILARRTPFLLTAPQSDIIIGAGHGSPSRFTGQNESVILEAGNLNPREVRGKVIKLLSCETGKMLGTDLVRNGAAAFLGYTEDFIWVMDSDLAKTPWADSLAATALMPVINGLNALLDGKTAGEALDIERQGYLINAAAEEDDLIRSVLEFDYDSAVLLGDTAAMVRRRPNIAPPFPPPPIILPLRR